MAADEPAARGRRRVVRVPRTIPRARRSVDVGAPGREGRAARRQRLREVDDAQGARRAAVPDSGRYTAFDAEVTEDHLEDEQFSQGFRSRVGFVFQNSDAQVFSPTVREEVAFGPAQHGPEPRRSRLTRRRHARHARHRRPGRSRAVPTVGRPEEARRDRVGARDEPRGAAVRRADGGARPPHPAVADRAHRRAERGRQDDRARHARPRHPRTARRPLHRVLRGSPHRGEGPTAQILGDEDLLVSVNLVHDHTHGHDGLRARPRRITAPTGLEALRS